MAIIRKHKGFVVLFLTLIFFVYAKQHNSLNFVFDSSKPDNAFYKNLLVVTPVHSSASQTERLTIHSFTLKKYVTDKVPINQPYCFEKFITFYKTTFDISIINLPSILKLICILRI